MGDDGFEPGTSATEVWCATNEPPPHDINIPRYACTLYNIMSPFHIMSVYSSIPLSSIYKD